MSLATRLEASKPVYKPTFAEALASLPDDDREALIVAAADPAWSNSALMRELKAEGIGVGKDSFGRWREQYVSR